MIRLLENERGRPTGRPLMWAARRGGGDDRRELGAATNSAVRNLNRSLVARISAAPSGGCLLSPGWRFAYPGYKLENSARRHAGADFGAQLVDQPEALLGLDVPEGPAVAGAGALRHRADAVDRADLVAEHDGAVSAHQGAMTLLGIDQ